MCGCLGGRLGEGLEPGDCWPLKAAGRGAAVRSAWASGTVLGRGACPRGLWASASSLLAWAEHIF